MPRATKATGKTRHDPLHVQLDEDELQQKYGRVSKPGKRVKSKAKEALDDESSEVRSSAARVGHVLMTVTLGHS